MKVDVCRLPDELLVDPKTWRCEHRHNGIDHSSCWYKFLGTPKPLRIGYLDIEASQLKADYGWMISWCIKHEGQKKFEGYVLQKKDYQANERDREAIARLRDCILLKFDKIVTYYGHDYQFDMPFVRTRSLRYGMEFIPGKTKFHDDVYRWAKSKLRLSSYRLDNVARLLGIKTKKTRIEPDIWVRAGLAYDEKALRYIWDHNKKDCVVLEEVHKRLKPYIGETRRYL